jgi:lipoate-protein ligase A
MAKKEKLGSIGSEKIYSASNKNEEFEQIIKEHNRIFKKKKGAVYMGYSHNPEPDDNIDYNEDFSDESEFRDD